MNDYVFKNKHLVLMSIAFLIMSASCFVFMGEFFEKATSDLLKIWLNTERVSLDQGNLISSFSKLQRSIGDESYIKGFIVSDSAGRTVFSAGEVFRFPTVHHNVDSFMVVGRGFFSNIQQAQFSKLRMTVYSSSAELMYIYLLIVGYIVLLSSAFSFFLKRIITREEQVKNEKELLRLTEIVKINEALSIQAKQVAHDIRSPLSIINMLMPSMNTDSSQEKVDLLMMAADRISSIAEDLLQKGRTANLNMSASGESLSEIVKHAITEKELQLAHKKSNLQINLSNNFSSDVKTSAIKISASDLSRILSNILNNAIETVEYKPAGLIQVRLSNNENKIRVEISDNGNGIPQQILKNIGMHGFSHGKPNGSGLGVYHAKTTIEDAGGSFEIESTVGVGTTVRIVI